MSRRGHSLSCFTVTSSPSCPKVSSWEGHGIVRITYHGGVQGTFSRLYLRLLAYRMHSLSLLDELFGLEELPQIKDLKQFFVWGAECCIGTQADPKSGSSLFCNADPVSGSRCRSRFWYRNRMKKADPWENADLFSIPDPEPKHWWVNSSNGLVDPFTSITIGK